MRFIIFNFETNILIFWYWCLFFIYKSDFLKLFWNGHIFKLIRFLDFNEQKCIPQEETSEFEHSWPERPPLEAALFDVDDRKPTLTPFWRNAVLVSTFISGIEADTSHLLRSTSKGTVGMVATSVSKVWQRYFLFMLILFLHF